MPEPQLPKYQAIYAALRRRIRSGELAPGAQLPPQQEMADEFGVTLMTLRQAIAVLQAEGLVWAARGRGTFVADPPIDIEVGNLSSFARQMQDAGVDLVTEVLDVTAVPAGSSPRAASALGVGRELCCLRRRRLVDGVPFCLQRSFLANDLGVVEPGGSFDGPSLYEAIERTTGSTIAEARERIKAIELDPDQARLLDALADRPALLSMRTSIDQFGKPFLYDEAVLVGERCTIAADRTTDRLVLRYHLGDDRGRG